MAPVDHQAGIPPAAPDGIRFAWSIPSKAGTTWTDLYVSTSPVFFLPVKASISGSQAYLTDKLLDSTVYFWRVIVKNAAGIFDSSAVYQFRTGTAPSTGLFHIEVMADTAVRVRDTVRLHGKVTGATLDTIEFRWDYNADKRWDDTIFTRDTIISTARVFQQVGIVTAALFARDKGTGSYVTDTVRITVSTTGLGILTIRADTSVITGDSISFSATATGSISLYLWDFDGNGTADFTSATTANTGYRYTKAGTYNAILTVKDSGGVIARDTARITVATTVPMTIKTLSRDTIIPWGGTVVCTVAVDGGTGALKIEIDTAGKGVYKTLSTNTRATSYRFIPDASSWDSVKVRATDAAGAGLNTGFRVRIRPRTLSISSIDSTASTITVRFTASMETDFKEYVIYRDTSITPDTTSNLFARITTVATTSYTSTASYALTPRYYRIYQRDTEGLLSAGSVPVHGCIVNTKITMPVLIRPPAGDSTMYANDTIRWLKSTDPNGAVRYSFALIGTPSRPVVNGLADTSFALTGLDTAGFTGSIRITAYGIPVTDTIVALRTGIRIKPVRRGSMRIIKAGSFTDALGRTATASRSFWMDTNEVTQEKYSAVSGGANPSFFKSAKAPLDNITWYQAIAYCNALSKAAGLDTVYTYTILTTLTETGLVCNWERKGYRLPTSDEWELAAHCGRQLTYPTSNNTVNCENVNYQPCTRAKPAVAGTYPSSPYGIHEMAGNVAEWCWDIYAAGGAPANRIDYHGSTNTLLKNTRTARGGSYVSATVQQLRADYTSGQRADRGTNATFGYMGFRCILPE